MLKFALLSLLIVPGLIAFYVIFLRPALSAIPALKKFYTEADGFWAKLSAIFGHSLTIVTGAVVSLIGLLAQALDPIAAAVGDPDLKNQITSALQSDPQILGYVMMGISVLTILARLRTIGKT